MNLSYLFPYRFKKISGIVFWLALLLFAILPFIDDFEFIEIKAKVFSLINSGVFSDTSYFDIAENDIKDEILFTLLILSGLIYAFSKEKTEDERVQKIRLDSLVWATYFNYILILLCYLFIYGIDFLNVMMAALFSHLLFFIIRFRWMLYRQNKSLDYEE